ncbi:isoprenyl transferase [Xylanivirga thermophila]|jgi:undecaprenyl diphosphate synthase|uniref:isoprenyl transferase n=1 Tax=Xylanivirga thermophila TaxID=2496273 RepID=UPI00101C4E24|nr:isoprenyl transferase [Xylanivirga thermophila]
MGFGRLFFRKRLKKNSDDSLIKQIKSRPLPTHVAIIMDGNGRWAKRYGLPRVAGHREGVESLREIVKTSSNIGIQYLTVFAFSTENWKRPRSEVAALMELLVKYLRSETDELNENNVKIVGLGDISALPKEAKMELYKSMNITKDNTGLQLNIALNYGGRDEIVRAARLISQDIINSKITTDDIDEELFSKYLYTADMPDPDLLIRTSGECRISNFLLYQIAYTEIWISDRNTMWPDFNPDLYKKAILNYQDRQRRYGGIAAK